jgi:hypothetical protein
MAFVPIVDKLYDILKSEEEKTIPFKFISLFALKELIKKCAENEKFLLYFSEKCCNKLARWCSQGKDLGEGATLFMQNPDEKRSNRH